MKISLLAGTHSGCGKTTVMLALLQYFKARRQSVIAFKSGPDFLDPLWHRAVTGKPSYNLDTLMIGVEKSREILARQAGRADCAVIEGVMGLFDGRSGVGSTGSSADLARILNAPVMLVVDAAGISGTIVPLVAGVCAYATRMGVAIGGVIANKVGSRHHAELLRELLQEHDMPPLIAWMTKGAPVLAERHLGLVRPGEGDIPDFLPFFQVEDNALKQAFAECQLQPESDQSERQLLNGKTVAVAKDSACCFIYQANLDWLRAQGGELRFFSVLAGEPVPDAADALWLPGGYPELYAEQLAQSASWPSLRQFIENDKPVLAECGGAMILGECLINHEGEHWPMAKMLPYVSKMQDKLASLGYRQEASGARGHEFHHSVRDMAGTLPAAFDCPRGDRGVRYRNLRASYVHWFFPSAPAVVAGWLS
ncbi:cobyrinate a,c-diamide synthase [Methylomarinum vadi]|uniref:cobyrinate a,c-diamide synthase n=1 Tax=Methylomarinum vadi TaxID=438855 RepID=UPI0004DEF9A5|nr:cobyrinate a,c-diamide synthase [Methylomarinum vadi]